MVMNSEELLALLDEFVSSSGPTNSKAASSENRQLLDLLTDTITDNYTNSSEIEPVLSALIKAYHRGGTWRLFVLQLIPAVVGTYLAALSKGEKRYCNHLETFLLSIYNTEILKSDGTRKLETVRLPTLLTPSIYHHDPSLLAIGGGLTETALSRFNAKDVGVVQIGPYPSCYVINAENRYVITTFLLKLYNSYLNVFDPLTLATYCKMCSRLCRSGFHFPETDLVQRVVRSEQGKDVFRHVADYSDLPRISLHSALMLEMLQGVYFAMFNNLTLLGVQALDDIRQRACFELYPDVVLVTNAIANSLVENPSGSPGEGPMGIHAVTSEEAVAAICNDNSFKRRLITNSSLRIRKLADDIPLRVPAESPSSAGSSSEHESAKSRSSVVSPTSITLNRPKLLTPMSDGGRAMPPLKESRSEMSMQDLMQKRAPADAFTEHRSRNAAILAEEDNFDVTSSEEPTPRRDQNRKTDGSSNGDIQPHRENGHGSNHRDRSVVETDV